MSSGCSCDATWAMQEAVHGGSQNSPHGFVLIRPCCKEIVWDTTSKGTCEGDGEADRAAPCLTLKHSMFALRSFVPCAYRRAGVTLCMVVSLSPVQINKHSSANSLSSLRGCRGEVSQGSIGGWKTMLPLRIISSRSYTIVLPSGRVAQAIGNVLVSWHHVC